MSKHAEQIMTISELINWIEGTKYCETEWYELLDLDLDDSDKEAEFLAKNKDCRVRIWWPDHVTVPHPNGDATYQLLDEEHTTQNTAPKTVTEYWQADPGCVETGRVRPGPPMEVYDRGNGQDNVEPGHPLSRWGLRPANNTNNFAEVRS
jgi:hypothetical protein